jgi:hypothetical protein
LSCRNFAVDSPKVGSITDISPGGLAFEYIGGENVSRGDSSLDIFLHGNGLHPHDVCCEIVYENDIYIPHVDDEFASLLTTRRCGIRFVRLSRFKREQIRFFIESNAY